MPERVDLFHLGEETVAADVEPVAVVLGRARDAAHHGVALGATVLVPPCRMFSQAAVRPAGPAPMITRCFGAGVTGAEGVLIETAAW